MGKYIFIETATAKTALKILPREDFVMLMEKFITGKDIPLSENAEFYYKQLVDFGKDKEGENE